MDHNLIEIRFRAPSWYRDAACRDKPVSMFFPERGDDADTAKRVCAECPVRESCLELALEYSEYTLPGVWGGTTGPERRILKRQRARAS